MPSDKQPEYPHIKGREEMWSKHNPFVQITWDSTSLASFMQCPRRYQYEIIEGWRPKAVSADLLFGTCIHESCGVYDVERMDGADHETALRRAVQFALHKSWGTTDPVTGEVMPNLDDCCDDKKNRHTLVRCLVWWADEFGAEDVLETIRLPDGRPAVELSFRLPLGLYRGSEEFGKEEEYFLCGHFDAAVMYAERPYVRERKSTKTTLGSYYFDRYSPNVQVSNYALASKVVLDQPAAGVIVEAFQTGVTLARMERHVAPRTMKYLEEWLGDVHAWIKRAEFDAGQRYWPKNEAACGLHGGCPFRKICAKDPGVRDLYLKGEFQQLPWNPLANR